ncbi:GNAT family N-acetyltransferase [Vibrio taketomensis]|uniref:GNAT family N-acetyltransferase n=1 Tax=Vibrio taketomensis TaxID=2572923 RepID=UPI00138A4555|nr:N-acetyltransferase [Vibrio taketomensis]
MKLTTLALNHKAQITELFTATFSDSEGVDEGKVIGELAEQLVATTPEQEMMIVGALDDEALIGCIVFTELKIAENNLRAYLLSPAAVATHAQGNGVGQKLIQFGLDNLKQQGVDVVVTYGDPSFYGKVGFAQITEEQLKAPLVLSYPHGWLGLKLDGSEFGLIAGETRCAPALNNQQYW